MSRRAARKLAKAERGAQPAGSRRGHITRAVRVALMLILFNYLGLPALAGVRNAVNKLADVEFGWLALGVGLQFSALLAYTQLMATGLPQRSIGIFRLFRIQLATKSLNNVVPGGSAAGAALGYRLLTTSGVAGSDAGFALAATGLISAVALNVIFLLSVGVHSVVRISPRVRDGCDLRVDPDCVCRVPRIRDCAWGSWC